MDDDISKIDVDALPYADPHLAVPRADARTVQHTAADFVETPTNDFAFGELFFYKIKLLREIAGDFKLLQQYLQGHSMSTDLKTTISGLFTSICGLLAIFHIAVPDVVSQIGTVIGVAVLGYFANKTK